MTDTASTDFASVTSDDIRPGETPAQARTRRKTEANRARRAEAAAQKAASKPPKSAPAASEPAQPAPTAPPRAEAPPARGPGRPTVKSKRTASTLGVISMVGVAVRPFNAADSDAILNGAEQLAASLAEVAETNRAVAKALDSITGTSAWAGVALAVYAIAAPIAVNHGLFGLGQPAPVGRPAPVVTPAEPEPYLPPPAGVSDFDPSTIAFTVADGVHLS